MCLVACVWLCVYLQILRNPIPLSYTRHTSRFLVLWLLWLPIALWGKVRAGIKNHRVTGVRAPKFPGSLPCLDASRYYPSGTRWILPATSGP